MKHLYRAALGGIIGLSLGSAALACETYHGYRIQTEGADYSIKLNGVQTAQDSDFSNHSRVGPFNQWVAEGENVVTVSIKQGSANVSLSRYCVGSYEGEVVVEASLTGPETRELTFFAENAPKPVYDDVATDDAGLKDALAALKTAIEAKDVEAYWDMHEGLRAAAAADGAPEEMMRRMITITVEEGKATYNDNLTFTPVLDGRVWQVFADGGEAPIVIEIKRDGGTNTMRTGAYWAKINGVWDVVGN